MNNLGFKRKNTIEDEGSGDVPSARVSILGDFAKKMESAKEVRFKMDKNG